MADSRILEEILSSYRNQDYGTIVARTDRLLKNPDTLNKLDTSSVTILKRFKISSLIQDGKYQPAYNLIMSLKSEKIDPMYLENIEYELSYTLYGLNRLEEALKVADAIPSKNENEYLKHLIAQILYKIGNYEKSFEIFQNIVKQRSEGASGWKLSSFTTKTNFISSEVEVATNVLAAKVMAKNLEPITNAPKGADSSFEYVFNKAYREIELGRLGEAKELLEKAKLICEKEWEGDEDAEEQLAEELAPIKVQLAYVTELNGDLEEAEKLYSAIIEDKSNDKGVLAVASNNFVKMKAESTTSFFDLQKKMKLTTGEQTLKKLNPQQKIIMTINRALVSLHAGRVEACRDELDDLKQIDPSSAKLYEIEAVLAHMTKKNEKLEEALNKLDSERGAFVRAELSVKDQNFLEAAKVLSNFSYPACVATAAALFEKGGDVDSAISLLTKAAESNPAAKTMLSKALLRHGKYEEVTKLLNFSPNDGSKDNELVAQMIVAVSHIDADLAQKYEAQLPPIESSSTRDIKALESLPVLGKTKGKTQVDKQEKTIEKTEKKKKKKKKRLPKHYDPNGPPPDPERWLPKYERSTYRKRQKKRQQDVSKGTQGANYSQVSASEKAQALKSEKYAASTNTKANTQDSSDQRPQGAKKKAGRRRK